MAEEPGVDIDLLPFGQAGDPPQEAVDPFAIPIGHLDVAAAVYYEEAVVVHLNNKEGSGIVPFLCAVDTGVEKAVFGGRDRDGIDLCPSVSAAGARACILEFAEGVLVGVHDDACFLIGFYIISIDHEATVGRQTFDVAVLSCSGIHSLLIQKGVALTCELVTIGKKLCAVGSLDDLHLGLGTGAGKGQVGTTIIGHPAGRGTAGIGRDRNASHRSCPCGRTLLRQRDSPHPRSNPPTGGKANSGKKRKGKRKKQENTKNTGRFQHKYASFENMHSR